MNYAQIAASLIAALTFAALAVGRVPRYQMNRAAMALVGAGLVLALGVLTLPQAEATIDLSTLILLLSMMVINAVLELGGFFSWIGGIGHCTGEFADDFA